MRQLEDARGFILADDTGLGKTLIALEVADRLAGEAGQVLILAPAMVVSAWVAHAARSHPHRDVRSIGGVGGIEAFSTGTHWLVVSYDYFARHHDAFLKPGAGRVAALLVCDEAHQLGQLKTLRRDCVATFPSGKVLLLTATPCSNDLMTLWSLLDLAEPGIAADPATWRRLVVQTMDMIRDGRSVGRSARVGKEWLDELVGRYLLRRTRRVGTLLPRYDYIVECAVSDVQRALATGAQKWSTGALGARAALAIATNPALLGTRGKPEPAGESLRSLLPDSWSDASDALSAAAPKMRTFVQMMIKILRETDEKVVVFADEIAPLKCYIAALKSTCTNLGLIGWECCELVGGLSNDVRDATIAKFNDPKSAFRVAMVSTKSGAAGLTLTGANRAIILYPSHNPMWDAQAFGRIHRPPQMKECFQYVLVTADSADAAVFCRQVMKSSVERCVFDPDARPLDLDGDAAAAIALNRAPRSAAELAAEPFGMLQTILRSEPVSVIADPILGSMLLTSPLVTAVFDLPDRSS